jgi:hypothetical protein
MRKQVRSNKSHIEWKMREMYHRLVRGEKDTNIMHSLLLSERNYYKYKKKLASRLEELQKSRTDDEIWLEVQILRDRMSNLYSVLSERVNDPRTKTSDLSALASTAESIAINLFKLESASFTAIKQSNILENYVNTQLPSRSKYKKLPEIIYNNNITGSEYNEIRESKNNENIYND